MKVLDEDPEGEKEMTAWEASLIAEAFRIFLI